MGATIRREEAAVECPQCLGTGEIPVTNADVDKHACGRCEGSGFVNQTFETLYGPDGEPIYREAV